MIALIIGAYLLGSLPIVYLIGRLRGADLRGEEDLHIALWRKVGRIEGLMGMLVDIAKGAIAVLIARALQFDLLFVCLAGLAAVVGEMWPAFFPFKGEKANSTGMGMAAALVPTPMLPALIPIAVGAGVKILPQMLVHDRSLSERFRFGGPPSKSLPLGMAIGFAVLPLSCLLMGWPVEVTLTCVALFILIMAKRVTAGLMADIKGSTSKATIIINRLLYDRSYL
jgi:hypothetical protein